MTIVLAQEPDTLDPQKSDTAVSDIVLRYVGDPLVRLAPSGQYVPGLATKWTISRDGLTYDFTLRQGVTFQDGTPVTAADWVSTFKRALNPATKSPVAGSSLGAVSSVKQTGTYGLEIRLSRPYAFFLHNLSDGGRLMALSPTALAKEGSSFGRHPVSTGPWMVSSWVTGSQITLVKNPNYHWGPSYTQSGPVHIDNLVFRIIVDEATQTAAFESGGVDELTLPSTAVVRLQAMHKYQISKFLHQGVFFIEFNIQKAPFNDIRVRQAMNFAIDKKPVVQIGISGQGVPAYGTLPPSIAGYWPGIVHYRYSYDTKKALALLAQAGWVQKNGALQKNGQPFTFTVFIWPDTAVKRAAQVVQSELKSLGIQMTIQSYDFGTLLSKVAAGAQQADFLGYTYSTADIEYIWFDTANIGTGLANSHDHDPKIDALIARMRALVDPAAQNAAIADLQRYLADQALWVPLWTAYDYIGLQPRVHGVIFDSLGVSDVILNNATVS
ncbi:MAG TPA: ABC transporter substrate-binding protein [Chloroflexota bacterium]|jgi:peptide/nickel transport system substrate-binding protein|nr:ABC transporter substrate-binding protein [Chloroflexota bacterium]